MCLGWTFCAHARPSTRARAGEPTLEFVLADATVHPFDPGRSDLLFSRFGVMFFADPALSFANMHKALRPGGRLAFACWREPRANPWMMVALQEAYSTFRACLRLDLTTRALSRLRASRGCGAS